MLILLGFASPAEAHAAFGDLGEFYQGLLHPIADPAQGLTIAAAAVLLARQPMHTFRVAYVAMCLASLATLVIGTVLELPGPGLRMQAILAFLVAVAAMVPVRPGAVPLAAIAAFLGIFVALPVDTGAGPRAVLRGLSGGFAGIVLATLLLWGVIDWASRRISPVSGAVASAWVAAIALMAAVLPA